MRLLPVAAALLILSGVARADSVVLRNGAEYEGILKEVTPDHLVIQSDGAEWTFAIEKVASWKRESAGVDREQSRARANLDALHAQARDRASEGVARRQRAVAQARVNIVADSAGLPSVIIYGTSWCGFCRKARAYFQARHVPFLDKDIERDMEAHDEMLNKCAAHGARYHGVPVIDVGGQLVLGFNPSQLDQLLARSH